MDELFNQFGLDKREGELFLELVRLGASPVSQWAKQTKTNRSSMYVILERLKKLGLITSFTHQGVTFVQAISMAELPARIADKQAEMERVRNNLIKNLPVLQKLEKSNGLVPKVTFYEGKNRVEMMYENVLKEKSFRAFFNPEKMKKTMPKYYQKVPEALRENRGRARELLIDCKEAREYKSEYGSERHEIKILGEEVIFSSDTIITDQKIFMVGYSDKEVVGTEIWNEELSKTQKEIFEMVWKGIR